MTITEKLANLPALPGVYIMKDAAGKIIYVGKAKILKNRVRQYFHDSANHTPKVSAMVSHIADFEYIVCDSEYEALCLESNLIKKNLPRYNILLKDDKHYPYIKVTVNEEYPKIMSVRRIENDGARYFGPYPGRGTVKNTLDAVRKIFKVQHCKKQFPRDIGRDRPCIYYSMGRCLAPCTGKVSSAEYKTLFKDICSFLDGDNSKLTESLETQMNEYAENFEFEKAAAVRDKIFGIKKLQNSQKVINEKTKDIDVIAFASNDDISVFRIFFIRNGKMIGDDLFRNETAVSLEKETIIEDFVRAYYSSKALIPDFVYCAVSQDSTGALSKWLTDLKGKKCEVRVPQRGEGKSLLTMAEKNAEISLTQYKIDILTHNSKEKAVSDLAEALQLPEPPVRIEAYDISNTSGSENVGSMVVFKKGKPEKSEYKKFKIKYIVGSNDYDCMREVLSRRFLRYHDGDKSFTDLPDLILVDGGTGHVHVALEALQNLNIHVPVYGMAKDDRHRTRALVGTEGEISLPVHSAAFRLITFIQDEAHRFAVTYHKKLRGKKAIESELEGIKGVGKKRQKELLKHFKSLKNIKTATLEELEAVPSIDKNTAKNIFDFFQNN